MACASRTCWSTKNLLKCLLHYSNFVMWMYQIVEVNAKLFSCQSFFDPPDFELCLLKFQAIHRAIEALSFTENLNVLQLRMYNILFHFQQISQVQFDILYLPKLFSNLLSVFGPCWISCLKTDACNWYLNFLGWNLWNMVLNLSLCPELLDG